MCIVQVSQRQESQAEEAGMDELLCSEMPKLPLGRTSRNPKMIFSLFQKNCDVVSDPVKA